MSDTEQIKALIDAVRAKAPAGFAIAFHIRLTSPDFLFQSYPKDWIDTYSEKGYVMIDPIVRFGFSNDGSKRWSQLEELDDHGILEQSAAFGMKYGVAIATESGNSRSVAGFARSDREYTDQEIAELTLDVQALHDLTASTTGMTKEVHDALHRLSIEMTHPGAT